MNSPGELLAQRDLQPSATDVLAEPLIGETRPIQRLYQQSWAPDDPTGITEYIGTVCNTKPLSFFGEDFNTVGGISPNPEIARRKAIGEAIERYCMSIVHEADLTHGTADLPNTVEPELFNKSREPVPESNEYYWVSVYDYFADERVQIPSQLVYVPSYSTGTFIRSPISTGAACHLSPKRAFTAGLLEAVERDAFMIHYLNQIPGQEITIDWARQRNAIVEHVKDFQFEIQLLYLQVDIPVHVVLCILTDPELSYFQLGLNAGFELEATAFDALIESFQGRHWLRTEDTAPEEVSTIEERAAFWRSRDSDTGIEHWTDATEVPTADVRSVDTVEELLEELRSKDMDLFVRELTTPDIKEHEFTVLKSIVPQLEPLYLDEAFRHVGGERLYDAPVTAGLLQQPRSRDELNDVPHPFI